MRGDDDMLEGARPPRQVMHLDAFKGSRDGADGSAEQDAAG